jgi:hypothetical protein
LRCRYAELLRLWSNVTTDADNQATSLGGLRDAFDRVSAQEDPSSHGPTYLQAERAKQMSTDHRKLAYAAAWVARSLAAYVKVADDAGLPWKHAESGWRAALAAGEERIVLWGAKVQLQRQVQHKRESYHLLSPAVRATLHAYCRFALELEHLQRARTMLQELTSIAAQTWLLRPSCGGNDWHPRMM